MLTYIDSKVTYCHETKIINQLFVNSQIMGILFSSKVKDDFICPSHESIINLSDHCLNRLTGNEKEKEEKKVVEEKVEEEVIEEEDEKDRCKSKRRILEEKKKKCDEEWMMKLKCFDDVHSNTHGITMQNFDNLLQQTMEDIGTVRDQLCAREDLIACMKKYPGCSIKCKQMADKYIDCIDTYRINIYKEFIECELKERRKEDQEIVEEFLKNGT